MHSNLNASSLFLIDEFGSGTEPTLGGAMAEAILEAIYQTDCYGIITTHYGNLKMFPDRFPEAINGAMLYDTRAMKPLFMLKIGKPGSSFTYEIARLIGLPEDIIHSATQKSGTAQIDYERKLEEIENEKIEIETRLRLVQAADEQLATMIADYQYKFNELDKQRKEILSKAKNQATTIIDNANKIIEKTIREIKESKADGVKTKVAREEIKC
jgi:DNA mismatch repair protein MutS2